MTDDQIAELEAHLQSTIDEFEKFSGREIPNTIDEASKALWEMSEDSDLGRLAYLAADQRADRKRLIRFGDALQLLQSMEEDLVEKVVLDEMDVMTAKLESIMNAFGWLADNWDDLPAQFGRAWDQAETAWEWFTQGIPALVRNLTIALALPAFYKVAKKTFMVRDKFPALMRQKALPQRIVVRKWRRKVTRL